MTNDFDSEQALKTARRDNAGCGYCAKGTANILEAQGLDITRGNAYTWKNTLPKNGWIKIEGMRPEDAPEGAVLVYDRNATPGKSGGARYGHVEVVAIDDHGKRQYVSDKARTNWGGSVPQNFVGVYVHPDMMSQQEIQMAADGCKAGEEPQNSGDDMRVASLGGRETGSFARELTDLFGGSSGPGDSLDMNKLGLTAIFAVAAAIFGGFDNDAPSENAPERQAPTVNFPSTHGFG